jgi:hypothetical protein
VLLLPLPLLGARHPTPLLPRRPEPVHSAPPPATARRVLRAARDRKDLRATEGPPATAVAHHLPVFAQDADFADFPDVEVVKV